MRASPAIRGGAYPAVRVLGGEGGGVTPPPVPAPARYPLRADFDPGKLPPLTRAAFAHVKRWHDTPDHQKQPDLAALVSGPEIHLKNFREISDAVHVVRVRALLGDLGAVVEFARQMRKLVTFAKTGYNTPPLGFTVASSPKHEQEGVRRFNIDEYDGGWRFSSGADGMDLDRTLSNASVAEGAELLAACAHLHPEIKAASEELDELLCVDLIVRHVYLVTSRHGASGKLWRILHGVTHAQTAGAYFFRVVAKRWEARPALLEMARELGARHGVTRFEPEELMDAYGTVVEGLKADRDYIRGPDGRTVVVFPHGNQRHYRATGAIKGDGQMYPSHHFTVYLPETFQRNFADLLGGGELATRYDLECFGNTVTNCVHIDGFDAGHTSDDMGGGGLQDDAEEARGASSFREVRFRGGGSAPSRWHLSDRTGIKDSRAHLATSGRRMVHSAMAFTNFPDRLDLLDRADKALGQDFRVGIDVARLLSAAVMEGVVKL